MRIHIIETYTGEEEYRILKMLRLFNIVNIHLGVADKGYSSVLFNCDDDLWESIVIILDLENRKLFYR